MSDPRDIIADYLRSQRLAEEAGVYDHVDRIEQLLNLGGWELVERAAAGGDPDA